MTRASGVILCCFRLSVQSTDGDRGNSTADLSVISYNWFFHEQLGDDVIKDWPDLEHVVVD
jgi:hypothetical protein